MPPSALAGMSRVWREAFLDGGARLIQLRAKHLSSAAFLDHTERLVDAADAYGASVIVNDRVDVALWQAQRGAHVGKRTSRRPLRAACSDPTRSSVTPHTRLRRSKRLRKSRSRTSPLGRSLALRRKQRGRACRAWASE